MNSHEWAKKTTITADAWLAKIRRDPHYDYRNSNWYRAVRALEQEAKQPPPEPRQALGQRCVYLSAVDDDVCRWIATLGPAYRALLSADLNLSQPGEAYYATNHQIATMKSGGCLVGSWCDCDSTPIEAAERMKAERGLDFFSGQFETCGQYRDMAEDGRCPLAVGNPAELRNNCPALLADATKKATDGVFDLIGEVMNPNPAYSAQGIPISSVCFYVDRDENMGGYQPLAAFSGHPPEQRKTCSVYTGRRMTAADRWLYVEWTKP